MNDLDPVVTVSDGICALLPRLRRFARAIAGHPADADDLLQVAIERALRHCAQWRPETPLQYWLFGIIRHAWLDEVRAQRRRRQLFVSAAEGEHVGDSPMERQQEWMAVQAAMAQLPDEQRWPIALVLIEGLSYRDAAAVLEIPIGTLTSRLARGREALQALLEEKS
ncbi:RNA polymerase sigma factor [Xanthomonas oryzae]|uniref:RNA polymerase sigma70 n=1 Tax=Xanthomonas oryzae pv. oryzae TaxID=64187 RepID=A0A854CL64_XANOO|nr:RNA polymerase sigma factor [Xanthomonas oryzae]AZK88751.1 RNA polymerase subunit sigma-70 [Xanthomonas oryzae pv. oryzae]OLG36674.1 RNA polymerase sigma70 [Xanthomonas oryzae pv. oryzae]OLG43376.1 RNA polymerase sigma70 [Xanthomonas oryzae pv. oryzae]OLG43432.1 RNA polymerase sigma70 [Xanthomonas oryzae pv. oryzae]OLG55499.1 RNA polymerase sigma70 [Xanthomonas oryzae pv. oryzae]